MNEDTSSAHEKMLLEACFNNEDAIVCGIPVDVLMMSSKSFEDGINTLAEGMRGNDLLTINVELERKPARLHKNLRGEYYVVSELFNTVQEVYANGMKKNEYTCYMHRYWCYPQKISVTFSVPYEVGMLQG